VNEMRDLGAQHRLYRFMDRNMVDSRTGIVGGGFLDGVPELPVNALRACMVLGFHLGDGSPPDEPPPNLCLSMPPSKGSDTDAFNAADLIRLKDYKGLVGLDISYHALPPNAKLQKDFKDAATTTGTSDGENVEAIPALAALGGLRALQIRSCLRIDDSTIAELAAGLPNLEKLDIGYCQKVGDGGLQALKALRWLRELNLEYCDRISDVGVTQTLPSLPKLQILSLEGTRVRNDSVQVLARCPGLQEINLSRTSVSGDAMAAGFKHMKQLHRVVLECCLQLTSAAFVGIAKQCPHLQQATLRGSQKLTDEALAELSQCQNLETLIVSDIKGLTFRGSDFSACPELRQIDAAATSAQDDAVVIWGNMGELRVVVLDKTPITDRSVDALIKAPKLHNLSIEGCHQVSNEAKKRWENHSKGLGARWAEKQKQQIAGFKGMVLDKDSSAEEVVQKSANAGGRRTTRGTKAGTSKVDPEISQRSQEALAQARQELDPGVGVGSVDRV